MKFYIILLTAAILLLAAFYNGLITRKYTVTTVKLNPGQSIRAVLIADLHSHIYGENQKRIISKIHKQNPDVILLAGDIADDAEPIDGTEMFLDGIKDIAPVFYATGNHEYWSGDIAGIKALFRSHGVTVLEDEYAEVTINGVPVIIAGLDDPDWTRFEQKNPAKMPDESFKALAGDARFKILVAHRPEQIELYKKYPFDLVVSGHAHGGQARIPFLLNGLIAPNQGLFPKYAGGRYDHGELTHIVSRGVSFSPRLPRVFNPPEVVVIAIHSLQKFPAQN